MLLPDREEQPPLSLQPAAFQRVSPLIPCLVPGVVFTALPLSLPPQSRSETLSPDLLLPWEELPSPPKVEASPGEELGTLPFVGMFFAAGETRQVPWASASPAPSRGWATASMRMRHSGAGRPPSGPARRVGVLQTWILGAPRPAGRTRSLSSGSSTQGAEKGCGLLVSA